MTIHSYGNWYSNFTCPACNAHYIPYAKDINCPQCGKNEGRGSDFIDLAVSSLKFNRRKYKSYHPPGWYKGSFSDHMLYLIFLLFESFRRVGRNTSFASFAEKWTNGVDFGEQEYSRKHLLEMVLDIRKQMPETRIESLGRFIKGLQRSSGE